MNERKVSIESLSREVKFEEVEQKRKEEQERREKNKNWYFDDTNQTGLEYNKPKILRIVSLPIEYRESSIDSKLVYQSRIYKSDENNSFCYINFPDPADNKDWFLYRLIKTPLEVEWNLGEDGKKKATYIYENSKDTKIKRLFNIFNYGNYGNLKQSSDFNRCWYPQHFVAMNVIDRMKYNEHKALKTSFLLARNEVTKVNDKTNESRTYYTTGIPKTTLYDDLYYRMLGECGDWRKYDIYIKKFEKPKKDNSKRIEIGYTIYNMFEKLEKIKKENQELFKQYEEAINVGLKNKNLTDEELSWDYYNLDEIYKVSSYSKIMQHFSDTIKEVDEAFHTNFYEELQDLVVQEEKEKNEEKENKGENNHSVNNPTPIESDEVIGDEENIKENIEENINIDKNIYKGYDLLTEKEKNCIKGIKEDGQFIYNLDAIEYDDLVENDRKTCLCACGFKYKGFMKHCPKCGAEIVE